MSWTTQSLPKYTFTYGTPSDNPSSWIDCQKLVNSSRYCCVKQHNQSSFCQFKLTVESAEHSVCLQLLHLCQSTNLQPKSLEIFDICASQNSFGPQLRRKERNQQKVTRSGYILLIFFRLRWSCLNYYYIWQ